MACDRNPQIFLAAGMSHATDKSRHHIRNSDVEIDEETETVIGTPICSSTSSETSGSKNEFMCCLGS